MQIPPAWKYYLSLHRGIFFSLFASLSLSLIQSAALPVILLLVRFIIDTVLPQQDMAMLIRATFSIFLLYLVNGGVGLYARYKTLSATKRVNSKLRMDIIERLYRLPRQEYSHADIGKLHSRVVQDTERLDTMDNAVVSILIPSLLVTLAIGISLVSANPRLLVVLLLTLPVSVLANRSFRRLLINSSDRFRRSSEAFSKGIMFVLQQLDLTHIQTAEEYETERQYAHVHRLQRTSAQMVWLFSVNSFIQSIIFIVANLVVLVIGGQAVIAGTMSLGDFLTFYVAFGLLGSHMQGLMSALSHVIVGQQALAALYPLMSESLPLPYTGTQEIDFQGNVTLQSVYFAYDTQTVLKDVSLEIRRGCIQAITGVSGAGKSTIIALIIGFYAPNKGMLLADGKPYSEIDLASLRKRIGVVLQDPMLFPGTIAENIAYGCPNATLDDIQAAGCSALVDEFVRHLENGYDTQIGENGVLLSGGQRQRVAVARAVLRQPTLLILDEPNNHLDNDTMQRMINNLFRLPASPAVLLVSHTTEVVQRADYIYHLEDGVLTHIPQKRT